MLDKKYYYLFSSLIFISSIFLAYYGLVHFKYAIAPGDDIHNHLSMAKELLSNPVLWRNGGYPPGFHYLVILVSYLFGGDLVKSITYIWPAFIVLSGLSLFICSSVLFGKRVGLMSYFLYVFISPHPLQTANDGTLASILGSNILLPLVFTSLYLLITRKNKILWLVILMFLSSVNIYSHHFSTIVLVSNLVLDTLIFSCLYFYNKTKEVRLIYIISLICLLVLISYVLRFSVIFAPERTIIKVAATLIDPGKLWSLINYTGSINIGIFYLSIIVIPFLVYQLINDIKINKRTSAIILMVWYGIYLVGSRMVWVGEPERMAREIAMPATILSGLVIVYLINYLSNKDKKYYAIFIVFAVLIFLPGLKFKANTLFSYNKMVRFSSADQQLLNTTDNQDVTYIFPKTGLADYYWLLIGEDRVNSGNVVIANLEKSKEVLSEGYCVYASTYKDDVWYPDNNRISDVAKLSSDNLRVEKKFEDPTKTWYILCK